MNTKKSILNFTLQQFKQDIKTVEDFPSLEDFVRWGDKHRVFLVLAFNHLVYVMKPRKNSETNELVKKYRH